MAKLAAKARLAEAEARLAELARLAKEARALEKPLVKTAEQLTAEAELAELRRLTPEQEAAAAMGQPHLRAGDGDAAASPRQPQGGVRRLGRAGRCAARVEGQVLHGRYAGPIERGLILYLITNQ